MEHRVRESMADANAPDGMAGFHECIDSLVEGRLRHFSNTLDCGRFGLLIYIF